MKILVINPNTSVYMTESIDTTARKYASPGTEITTVNPVDGPDYLANDHDEAIQAPKVLNLIEKNKRNYDAFIIACGSDPGLEACRLVTRNVIGIGEASVMSACALSRKFSFLCSNASVVLAIRNFLHTLGVYPSRLASARSVGNLKRDEIVRKRHQMVDFYCEVGRHCIEEDGAGALVFSCAGMGDLKEPLEKTLGVPVISGVVSAVQLAELLPY